ncbi:hypothetical protein DH2020_009321 [Rehmannia glutinosa]|uniref:SPX domain-containing protein n=1 Tax=Rehmannia glutinosa TaxID=99300 RepID=A0ABR0X6W0_REHGL
MKFGKEFRIHLEKTLPEWRDKFLCYKLLKKLLKRYPASVAVNLPPDVHAAAPLPALQEWFVAILYEELEKFNDFYVEKEEDFIIRFQALKERIERVKERQGLIKILKKYDKTNGELLSLPFTQLAFYQPFFTIEPLTRLVRECEENLEILFPLESEVVEPTTVAEEQTSIAPSDMSNASLETTLPLGKKL